MHWTILSPRWKCNLRNMNYFIVLWGKSRHQEDSISVQIVFKTLPEVRQDLSHILSYLWQPVFMYNLKAGDRMQFRKVNTVPMALDSIVNAFVRESHQALSFFITVYVHEAYDNWHISIKKDLLFSLATQKALEESREQNSIELYSWPQRDVSYLSTEQQLRMKWGMASSSYILVDGSRNKISC